MSFEKQFTLRLSSEESAILEELQLLTSELNNTAVIRYLIRNYKALTSRLSVAERNKSALEIENRSLRNSISSFVSAFRGLEITCDK